MKVYMVFTGKEDFAPGNIAKLGDVHMYETGDPERYAVFSDPEKAAKFLSRLKNEAYPMVMLSQLSTFGIGPFKYPEAVVHEFEVIE